MSRGQLLINGVWSDGERMAFDSIDPSYGHVVWQGKSASEAQVEHAVAAARAAFFKWSALSFEERLTYLKRFRDLLADAQDDIAQTIGLEVGKALWDAKGEVSAMIGKLDLSVAAYQERTGVVEREMAGAKAWVRHRAHGVVAVFGPYNFPGHLPNGHIIPALLAGNTIVFKPSEMAPLVAEKTVELWDQAGLPPGVLNLVQGERETGRALASQPDIDGLFFTGSAAVGQQLHEQFAQMPEKILALELGGNNPLIVGTVSDVSATVYHIVQSAYITTGQRCTCARRLFLPKDAQGDRVLTALIKATKKMIVGPYDADPAPFMGAMVSSKAAKQMLLAQQKLKSLGAVSLVDLEHPDPRTGIVSPGLMEVTGVSTVPDEEFFGPLLQVIRYDEFDEAIEQANATQFGLSGGVLSDSEDQYRRYWSRARAGIINWNRPTTGASGSAPFGGVGVSGNHRPSAYYAADYCAYPVASVEDDALSVPEKTPPGLTLL